MKLYCPKCNKLVEFFTKTMDESFNVKGDVIQIQSEVSFCKECETKIFNEIIDDRNLNLAYSIYRKKHNLLTPKQITDIRKKYLLSQRALSKLLEWGEVTINRYETGAIQDSAHNEVLQFISDPQNMKELFEKNGQFLNSTTRDKLEIRITDLIAGELRPHLIEALENCMAFNKSIDEYSGFNHFRLEKIINMIHYISEKTDGVYTTKLNKLLWYSDFLNFNKYSKSISGSTYIHLAFGPVPNDFQWIIAAAIDEGIIAYEEVITSAGYSGNLYKAITRCDETYFSEDEKSVMDFVINYFKEYNCGAIKEKSHQEDAYKKTNDNEQISYKYAASLSIQ